MTIVPLERGYCSKAERDKLLARIDDLQAELSELRASIKPDSCLVAGFHGLGFSYGQAQILAVLHQSTVPVANLQLALRAGVGTLWKKRTDEGPSENSLKCQIHHIRRKIIQRGGPHDAIETLWHFGYRMRPEARTWLSSLLPQSAPTDAETRATDDPGAIAGASRND